MNKTISINIAGVIFHIEEDGYEKLRSYLNSIQKYFSTYEDSTEIISDIEGRVAERFIKKQKTEAKQALSLADVDELMVAMGSVADFEAIEDTESILDQPSKPKITENTPPQQPTKSQNRPLVRDTKRKLLGGVCAGIAHHLNIDPLFVRLAFLVVLMGLPPLMGSIDHDLLEVFGPLSGISILLYIALWASFPASNTLEEDQKIKKFYRNNEQKVIGGIASGVAAYFGVDVGIVRFAWVLSVFLFGIGFVLYFVLWAITPLAKTLTEKMQMEGQPITLENIETNVKRALQPDQSVENTFTRLLLLPFRAIAAIFRGLTPFAHFLVSAIRVFASLVMIMIGSLVLIGLIIGLSVFLGLSSFDFSVIDGDFPPLAFFAGEVSPAAYFFSFLAIGVPFAALSWFGVSLLTRKNRFTPAVWQTLLGLFIVGIMGSTIFGARYVREFQSDGSYEQKKFYDYPKQTLVLGVKEGGLENNYRNVDFDLYGHEASNISTQLKFRSQGRSRAIAQQNAQQMTYGIVQKDSALVFDTNMGIGSKSKFRGQGLDLKVYLPYNKPFAMTREFYRHFWIQGRSDYQYDLKGADDYGNDNDADFLKIRWAIKNDSGLVCLNRKMIVEEDSKFNEPENENFDDNESQLNESFDTAFDPNIQYNENKEISLNDYKKVKISGAHHVKIIQSQDFGVSIKGNRQDIDKVKISMDGKTLVVESVNTNNNSNNDDYTLITILMPSIEELKIDGACNVKASGFDNNKALKIGIGGASQLKLDGRFDELNTKISGASNVELHGDSRQLKAEVEGASSLYAQSAKIQKANVNATEASRVYLSRIADLKTNADMASQIKVRE